MKSSSSATVATVALTWPAGKHPPRSRRSRLGIMDASMSERSYDAYGRREPATFQELFLHTAEWQGFIRHGSRHKKGAPSPAYNPDYQYLLCYCNDEFGSADTNALVKLRDRYVAKTGKTDEQTRATTLNEMAVFFRPGGKAPPPTGKEEGKGSKPCAAFSELLFAIENADLSKTQEKVLRLVAQCGGSVPIVNANTLCDCDALSAFKRAKEEMKKHGWHLCEKNTALRAVPLKKRVQK